MLDSTSFYLQDSSSLTGDRVMWWSAGGGYTSNLTEARIFTEEDAARQHACRGQDIPWPQAYIESYTHPAVDHQYVRRDHDSAAEGPAFYVQVTQAYDGNDMVWLNGGNQTSNLSRAQVFSAEEAAALCASHPRCVPWSCDYIDGMARMVVCASHLQRARVKSRHGFDVPKAPRKEYLRQRYTCQGCHIFMSEAQFWVGCCHRCGCDSRP